MNLVSASKYPGAETYLVEIEKILHDFLYPEHDSTQLRKREQILQSATQLFVTHGYRKTSMEEVAAAAGIAKGTVYLYYRNKAELLLHTIAFQNQQYMGELASVLDPVLPPRDQLRRLIYLSLVMSREAPLLARMTSGDHEINLVLRDIDDDTLSKVNQIKIDFIVKLIDTATNGKLAPVVVEQRAIALLDLVFAIISTDRWVQTEISQEDYAHQMSDIITRGIAG
jgi:AcrR family transcriptional regulator